jgi:hypothetical protein
MIQEYSITFYDRIVVVVRVLRHSMRNVISTIQKLTEADWRFLGEEAELQLYKTLTIVKRNCYTTNSLGIQISLPLIKDKYSVLEWNGTA